MVITANQNRQPPSAPSPPVVAQQALKELVQYYRELVDYHRSSADYHQKLLEQHTEEAEVAEKQLANIEAFLNPLQTIQAPESNSDDASPTTESVKTAMGKEEKTSPPLSVNGKQIEDTESPDSSEDKSQATDAEKSQSETSTLVSQDLSKNKSKTQGRSTKANQTKSERGRSSKSTRQKNTSKSKKNKSKQVSSSKASSSKLPPSDKLDSGQTIVDAVAICLQEFYPKVLKAEDLVNYYYPEGLEREAKKRAQATFSNCLSKGAGKQGWIRASIGKYRWKDEG